MADDGSSDAESKRILIVDDEEDLRKILGATLSSNGYQVTTAADVPSAQKILLEGQIGLVLSDVRMPGATGIDLMVWIKEQNLSKVRVVLMTGFSEVADTLDASRLGARGFLMKPFKTEALLEVLQKALMRVSWADFDEKAYASLTISEFISPPALKFSLYIRLHDGRFLKIGEPGDVVPRDKLLELRTKGINEIWLGMEDFKVYKEEQVKVARAVIKRTDISSENRIKMLKSAGELAFEQMRLMGVNNERVAEAIEVMKAAIEVILESDTSVATQLLESSNATVYSHSVSAAVLAATYTKLMGWSAAKNINMLILSAFLHDVGLCEFPVALQMKKILFMDKEERALYETHPKRSYDLLSEVKGLPNEVPLIILQHHETAAGTGYPLRLSKTDIMPLARVVHLIDRYLEEWERLPIAEKSVPNAAVTTLNRLVTSDPMSFERKDVMAMELALSNMDMSKARRKLQSLD